MGGVGGGAHDWPDYIKDVHTAVIGSKTAWNSLAASNTLVSTLRAQLALANPYSAVGTVTDNIALNPENVSSTGIIKTKEFTDAIDTYREEFETFAAQDDGNPLSGLVEKAQDFVRKIPTGAISISKGLQQGQDAAAAVQGDVSELIEAFNGDSANWADVIDLVETRLEEVVPGIDAQGILGRAQGVALSVITVGMEKSLESNKALTDAIAAFRARQNADRDIAFGRIDNNAAVRGTAESSSTLFAKAAIEMEKSQVNAEYEAQLQAQLYNVTLSAFASFFSEGSRIGSFAANQDSENRLSFFQNSTAQVISDRADYRARLLEVYSRLVGHGISEEIRRYVTEIQTQLQSERGEEEMKLEYAQRQLMTITHLHEMRLQGTQLMGEGKRLRYALAEDFYRFRADFAKMGQHHKMELTQSALDLVLGPLASSRVPNRVSRGANAIAGAAGGGMLGIRAAGALSAAAKAGGGAALSGGATALLSIGGALLGGAAGFFQ